MKKNDCFIILSLLCSLFIYLFYRTDKTVINKIFISIVSADTFVKWRQCVTSALALNEHIVFSLPGGLWVFAITLTSKSLFLKWGSHEIDLIILPLVFSIGIELFQLFHLTHGQFDFWDIGFCVLFWAIARYLLKDESARQNILHPFTGRSFICLLSYLVVYLAHV